MREDPKELVTLAIAIATGSSSDARTHERILSSGYVKKIFEGREQ
jgi:hypothetical protein